jgi:hypothetical protein
MSILYWVCYPSAQAKPTAAQVRAGQNAAGSTLPAGQKGSETATLTGSGTFTWAIGASGLSAGTSYKFAAVTDLGSDAAVVESAAWSTTSPTVVGGMAISELLDQAAFSGARTYFGAFAVTEVRDTAAFVGTMIPKFHTGTLAAVETQIDTFAATGVVGPPTGRSGDLLATEQRDTTAFSGVKTHFGTLAATEARDNTAFAGTMIPKFITGEMSPEEARDVFAATGTATTGVPVSGGLAVTEAGAKTYAGSLAAAEARDSAAFAGFITKFITGSLAALEGRDVAQFDAEPRSSRNNIILRDANVGLNVTPQQPWRDGAPANPDGTLLPTRLGHANVVNNYTNRGDLNRRQVRLLQAPQATQALVDIVPGWYAFIPVVAGEWVWCISRDNIVDDADNPIGQDDVVV